MHNYANLRKTMNATDPTLYKSLSIIMRKTCANFQPDPIGSYGEKQRLLKKLMNYAYFFHDNA